MELLHPFAFVSSSLASLVAYGISSAPVRYFLFQLSAKDWIFINVHSGAKIKGPISRLSERDQSCTVVTATRLVAIGGEK